MPFLDKGLTDAALRSLLKNPPPQGTQTDYFDDPAKGGLRGLFVKHSYGGTLTWYLMWYDKGKSKAHKLGRYPALTLAVARNEAKRLQVELNDDPDHLTKRRQAEIEADAKRLTFAMVVATFEKLYIAKNGLRTGKVMMQQINKHLMPKFAEREFKTIKRLEIAEHLDVIEEQHGAAMANSVLAVFRSIAGFHASRDNEYNSPIVKQMKRYKPKPRTRVLDDAEIKAFWAASAKLGVYGALARIGLLTGQRKAKLANMKWSDIRDGIWTLGHEEREKPNAGKIKLPALALSIIESQPRLDKNPYVFPAMHKRAKPFNAFGQFAIILTKAEREIIPDMPSHTLHDLRRTFRTKCSELGIARDTAERCIGHTIGSIVERTYDQHKYFNATSHAFATVAQHVQTLVDPPPSNVVSLRRERAQGRRARTPASGTP
jgi:integrase